MFAHRSVRIVVQIVFQRNDGVFAFQFVGVAGDVILRIGVQTAVFVGCGCTELFKFFGRCSEFALLEECASFVKQMIIVVAYSRFLSQSVTARNEQCQTND